jgi:hypothetical protein
MSNKIPKNNSQNNNLAPKSLTHKEIMFVLSGLMVGLLLAALDQTIVSTALKSIVEDFDGLIVFACHGIRIGQGVLIFWITWICICNRFD